jgi:hypothetical protein
MTDINWRTDWENADSSKDLIVKYKSNHTFYRGGDANIDWKNSMDSPNVWNKPLCFAIVS